jgi:hypothetical protein
MPIRDASTDQACIKGGAKVTSPRHHADKFEAQRHGTCHRCGWAGPVARVGRSQRRTLAVGLQYGRLCGDCVTDLLHGQTHSVHPGAAIPAWLQAVRDRHVA